MTISPRILCFSWNFFSKLCFLPSSKFFDQVIWSMPGPYLFIIWAAPSGSRMSRTLLIAIVIACQVFVCVVLVFICTIYHTCAMTLLIGDFHVRRFQQFLSASNVEPFYITGLGALDFFGISGGSTRNVDHTECFYSAVEDCRSQNLIVNLDSSDLDSSEDVDNIFLRLIGFHLLNIVVFCFVKHYRTRNIPTHLPMAPHLACFFSCTYVSCHVHVVFFF